MNKNNIKLEIEYLKKVVTKKFQPSNEEIRREGRIMDSIFASTEYKELKTAIKEKRIKDAIIIIEKVPSDKKSYYEGCMQFQLDHFDELSDKPPYPYSKGYPYKC